MPRLTEPTCIFWPRILNISKGTNLLSYLLCIFSHQKLMKKVKHIVIKLYDVVFTLWHNLVSASEMLTSTCSPLVSKHRLVVNWRMKFGTCIYRNEGI